MKNILRFFIAAAVVVLAPVSCEKAGYLDKRPTTQIAPEDYFRNENQFKLATIGAYEAMHTSTMTGLPVSGGTYHCGLMQMMCAPSDEILTTQNAADSYGAYTELIRGSFSESTSGLRRFWDAFYGGINRCNSVICNAPNVDSLKVAGYVAECTFLRGFYYWYLAQFFGAVPIVRYHGDGQEPRACLKDLYAYILNDFETAYKTLSADRTGVLSRGSATKWTAAAYIGKVCNYLAACRRSGVGAELVAEQPLNDFSWVNADSLSSVALSYLKDVVENCGGAYSLADDFRNLFRETTKDDQYQECLLLADFYLDGSEGGFPASGPFAFSPSSLGRADYGQTPDVWARYAIPTPKMFAFYSPEDPRRDWFFTGPALGTVNGGIIVEERASDGIIYVKPADFGKAAEAWQVDSRQQTYLPFLTEEKMACGKYRFAQIGQVTTHTFTLQGMSIPLMRLAEVYLMYAEAIYYADPSKEEEAREQFYPVLKRACGGDDLLATELTAKYRKDDFLKELMETRERELCFEGSRKHDLFRFNLMDKEIKALYEQKVGVFDEKDWFQFNSYRRFDDGAVIPIYPTGHYLENGAAALHDNWAPYKIWAPISTLQIAANPNLTQNAKW